MGVFDESERRSAEVSPAGSPVRPARRPWPLSARLLVGGLFAVNILLAAFIVRTEIKRPGAPATATPLTLERPKAGPSQQPTVPVNAQPNGPVGQGASLDGKTPPAEGAMPAGLPGTQMAKRPANDAQRATKTPHPDSQASIPRAGVNPPLERLGPTPAPARAPAASSGSTQGPSANVAPPALAASFDARGSGVPGSAAQPANAPAPSVLAPPATGHASTVKGARPATMNKVASVGLPAMEKGLVIPKRPVAPISPKLEIVPRSAGERVNCGDEDTFIACPTLQTRPETPIPSEDR